MVKMQTFFTALADRTRRRILNLIRRQEICVYFLTDILEISQPKISRHLAYLRNAEIVTARREGKWMYYRILEPQDSHAAQILRDTLRWLEDDEQMRRDYAKLITVCASLDAPATNTGKARLDILPEANMKAHKHQELETYLL